MKLSPTELRVSEISKITKRPLSTLYQWIENREFPVKRYGGIIAVDREVFRRWWETTGKYKEWREGGRKKNYRRLTENEIEYILENYTKKTIRQIAGDLNRGYQTIHKVIARLDRGERFKRKKKKQLIPDIISNEKFYLNWRIINYYATKEFQKIGG